MGSDEMKKVLRKTIDNCLLLDENGSWKSSEYIIYEDNLQRLVEELTEILEDEIELAKNYLIKEIERLERFNF